MKRTRAEIDNYWRAKLTQPLRFGDRSQLEILRQWLAAIAEFDELERLRNDPDAPLREWRVGYSYRTEDEEIVEAVSEKEAKEFIREDYGDLEDFEIEYVEQYNRPQKKKVESESRQLAL